MHFKALIYMSIWNVHGFLETNIKHIQSFILWDLQDSLQRNLQFSNNRGEKPYKF